MSAFIVQHDCINRIVSFMLKRLDDTDCQYLALEDSNPLYGGFQRPPKKAEEIGQQMHALNVEAVNHRYGENPDMLPKTPYKFHVVPGASDGQILKSLSCFLYQCSEGDVDKKPLFKKLDKFRDSLAYCIATNTPEYETATWG